MMVVLLIVAIIAAASAPMVTKKLSRNTGSGDSPWVFTGLNNNIAYNMGGNDNATVIIGASQTPANMQGTTRLYIDSGNNASHIAFGNGDSTPLLLTADPTRGRIGFSNQNIPDSSVAFGTGQSISNDNNIVAIGTGAQTQDAWATAVGSGAIAGAQGSVALGRAATASGNQSIAIGGSETDRTIARGGNNIAIGSEAQTSNNDHAVAIGSIARAQGASTIAIGEGANASNSSSVAIGDGAEASGFGSIAIGDGAVAKARTSIAIGDGAKVDHSNYTNSTAIGAGASTTASNQIVLGTATSTVYIPGQLIVGRGAVLGLQTGSRNFLRFNNNGSRWYGELGSEDDGANAFMHQWAQNNGTVNYSTAISNLSDRRLKNVGEKYTAGLSELKKLDFFHYTFKNDDAKIPHVGVMAQDLQKVFPDAVAKAEDGYLHIRWDEMFYAVINAVKELDNKITEIVQNITDMRSTIEKQNKTIEEQQKMLEQQQQLIKNLEKRIEKLEG